MVSDTFFNASTVPSPLRKVLDRLITLAKEKDLAYLKAEIYDFNQVSQSLFKSHGFEKIGKEMYKLDLK